MICRRLYGYNIIGIFLLTGLIGMAGCSSDSYIKRNVKGPVVRDLLTRGTSIADADGGTFTKTGWQPGQNGTLTYNIPAMPQGIISMDVAGLSRTAPDTIFLTLFEKPAMEYTDPYISKNPYLITLEIRNFQNSPESPFAFQWTIKNFPTGTAENDRYVDGIPSTVPGYQKTLASKSYPIFPDALHRVQIRWQFGKAQLIVNDEILAEHDFQPLLFNTGNLRLVIGKSPIASSSGLNDCTISNVWISYPSIYSGGLQ